ncbi:MAG: PIN domain-containing protein [Nanoarchaeota archaeon]
MNTLAIDSNILISAIIKEGKIREIITNFKLNLILPEFGLNEIYNHKDELMKKSSLDNYEFDVLILRLMKYIRLIPNELLIQYKNKAEEIMKDIDLDDKIFIAVALAFNCPIWSDDKHFKKQTEVQTYNTEEIIQLLK